MTIKNVKLSKSLKSSHVDKADVEFFSGVATLKVPSDVYVVISHNACDDVRGGNALCPLGRCKHSYGIPNKNVFKMCV